MDCMKILCHNTTSAVITFYSGFLWQEGITVFHATKKDDKTGSSFHRKLILLLNTS